MKQVDKRFLITGCGAPGIRGTLYSLKHNEFWSSCACIGVDINARAVGQYFVDRFYTVPKVTEPDYNQTLLDIALNENIDLIIPQTSREVAHLAQHQDFFTANGVNVLVNAAQTIAIAENKYELLNTFQTLKLACPEFAYVTQFSQLESTIKQLGYPKRPVVIKLPIANGSRGMRIISSASMSLDSFIQDKPSSAHMSLESCLGLFKHNISRFPPLLVMAYLPGMEWSVDIFQSRDLQQRIIIPRQRNCIRSGIAFTTTVMPCEQISSQIDCLLDELPLTGAFGLQFKCTQADEPRLLECNPRIQGTMVASTFAGANIIALACADALGLRYALPNAGSIQWGTVFERYWGGVGIDVHNASMGDI